MPLKNLQKAMQFQIIRTSPATWQRWTKTWNNIK